MKNNMNQINEMKSKKSQKYIIILSDDLTGPAYGVGRTMVEARADAEASGFGRSGVARYITKSSYDAIRLGNPDAVEFDED